MYVPCLALKCIYIYPIFFKPLYPTYGGISASFVTPLGSFNVGFDGSPNGLLGWFVTIWDIECSTLWLFYHCPCWVWVDDGTWWARLDNGIYWVYQLPPPPPSFVVVLTCNDNHKKMEGFLFKRDPWDSVLVAFNAQWRHCTCHGHVAHSDWWMPLFGSRGFWFSRWFQSPRLGFF